MIWQRQGVWFVSMLLGVLFWPAGAARAQASLERVRTRGEIVIATDASYRPFEYIEKGRLQGFDIDLGNEIGKEIGVRIRWEPMEWAGIFGALEARKVDLIMSGVTITDERKETYGFSRPYFLSGQTIARRRGDTRIGNANDLKGKTVSVQVSTTGQTAVERLGVPSDRIIKLDQLDDALFDVRNRRSDAAVADLPALQSILRQRFPELEIVGGIFVEENVGIVARKTETDLIGAINDALDRILADGRYASLYAKWMPEPLTPQTIAALDRIKDQGTPVSVTTSPGGTAPLAATPETAPPGSAFTIRWDLLRESLPYLLGGARMTLYVTALTLLLGAPAGLLVALARLSSFAPLRLVATVYVEVVRGTPLLLQIYVIYFIMPALGLNLPALPAAVVALSLNAAAYISEIFRAGIQSIDAGQMEAARALGMDYRGAMRWVILPQTVRRVLPPLTNEAVALLKDSSLISIVGLSELMRRSKDLVATVPPTSVYLAVALLYLLMTLPLTALVRRLEAKWQPVSRPREQAAKPLGKAA